MRRKEHTEASDGKPKQRSNNSSKKKSKINFKTILVVALNKYEQEVRSIAESLLVYGGQYGGCASEVHSMALSDQVPIDRLYSWMCYLKSEIARSHFMTQVGNHDPVPEIQDHEHWSRRSEEIRQHKDTESGDN